MGVLNHVGLVVPVGRDLQVTAQPEGYRPDLPYLAAPRTLEPPAHMCLSAECHLSTGYPQHVESISTRGQDVVVSEGWSKVR